MEWLQVIGYPDYFVNAKYEVRHRECMLTGPHVSLRRSDRRQICVKKKRLFLLTTMGIDPFIAIGSKVDTYEIEGCLRIVAGLDRGSLQSVSLRRFGHRS